MINPRDIKKKDIAKLFREDFEAFMEFHFPPKNVYEYDQHTRDKVERIVGGWKTREWQKSVLKSKHRGKILRVNRRAGKSYFICACLLWKAATRKNVEILVVAPQDLQVIQLFNTIMQKFINISDRYKSVYYDKKRAKPKQIFFKTGSVILFQTSGTRSGSGGKGIRGQGADIIVIDEADYIDDEDIGSIYPIFWDNPNVEVFMTSTPTGKDSKFKEMCENAYDYKTKRKPLKETFETWCHFHYTCWETLPHWNEKLDSEAREILGPRYEQEMLAEFGKEVLGAFNKENINQCTELGKNIYNYTALDYPTYGYPSSDPDPETGVNVMGIDWDKVQSGPTMLVAKIFYDSNLPKTDQRYMQSRVKMKILKHKVIPIQDLSGSIGVDTALDLIKKYNVKYVYTDTGGGGDIARDFIQKELIDSKVLDPKNVIRQPFNETKKWRDNFSGKEIKMCAKQVMYQLTSNKIDTLSIIFNPNDNILTSQLKNYRIIGINASGNFKFSSENEHSVDALMLCVMAAYEQLSEMFNIDVNTPSRRNMLVDYKKSFNEGSRESKNKRFVPDESIPGNTGYDSDGEKIPIILRDTHEVSQLRRTIKKNVSFRRKFNSGKVKGRNFKRRSF